MSTPATIPLFDIELARAQIELLRGVADRPVCVRTWHDKDKSRDASKLYGTINELAPVIESKQQEGCGAFIVVNEGGDTDAAITKVKAVFVDADDVPLPSAWHLQPDFIVQRDATHWHAYWLALDIPVERFREIQRRLAAHYGTDPAVCNLSRVMRLAGSVHQKGERTPVTLTDMSGGELPCLLGHSEEEIASGLPEITAIAARERTADGEPVEAATLREALSYLDPSEHYDTWRNIVAGTGSANCAEAREIAHEWSQGRLDRLKRYEHVAPRGYDGPEPVDLVLDTMPAKAGGVGVGTVAAFAAAAGWKGTIAPRPSMPPAQELFARFADTHAAIGPVSFRDVLNRTVPPVQELVPGLVERGTVTFLSAPGGSHKSRVAVQWGLSIDAGVPIFGRPVERARFVYVSYEDHADEVARRSQAIARRLSLPTDSDGQFWDLSGKDMPLALVHESGECTTQPFWETLRANLTSIAGHKFLVIDSTYNALRFVGAAKINEGAVMAGIGLLQRLCDESDATLLVLWHPSQSGQERGDSSGWSVAWHNAPRARLSLSPVKDIEGAYDLKVEKRNHGPKGKPLTLHWSDGVLLPYTETDSVEQRAHLMDACVRVAEAAAGQGAPIQKQRRLNVWMIDEIERAVGRRPNEREVKEELARALSLGRLRYINATQKRTAGYYPPNPDMAAALANAAKLREKEAPDA